MSKLYHPFSRKRLHFPSKNNIILYEVKLQKIILME